MEDTNSYNYGISLNSETDIDVSNPDDTGATGWKYDTNSHTITIFAPNDYTLTGMTNENKIIIEPASGYSKSPFNLVIQNLSINKSNEDNSAAISIKNSAFCRLLLYGNNNNFIAGANAAAINVSSNSSLEIDELIPNRGGHLSATGGNYASCIGANANEGYGDITIKDISMYLYASLDGSGVGYGNIKNGIEGISGSIIFTGGETYINSKSGASLGSDGIRCNTLEISGGHITAHGSNNGGSGISVSGRTVDKNEIIINGDAEIITYGGYGGCGINCYSPDVRSKLIIKKGTITAYGGYGAAGIGTGYFSSSFNQMEEIYIDGGVITAHGGYRAAGIGTGFCNNSKLGKIEITKGIVSAYGNNGGAGIGSGVGGKSYYIKISSSAGIIAKGGNEYAYDIGSSSNGSEYYSRLYSGLYSGIFKGEVLGTYQGKLSGIFDGEVSREYTKKISSAVSGYYTGKATGTYSGLFCGKFSGYFKNK